MTVCLVAMGVYFFLDERNLMSDYGWLPITSLIGFILFYCVGFGPLPFTVLSEMFAPEIKSVATSFAISACWIVDFAVTKAFLPLETVIGAYGNFWLFGCLCIVAFFFTSTMVFETKGLSLNQIQDKLNGRKSVS
jgi:SP family facilitated glucose transporter-like MFS transporter 8